MGGACRYRSRARAAPLTGGVRPDRAPDGDGDAEHRHPRDRGRVPDRDVRAQPREQDLDGLRARRSADGALPRDQVRRHRARRHLAGVGRQHVQVRLGARLVVPELDLERARRDIDGHFFLPVQVARNVQGPNIRSAGGPKTRWPIRLQIRWIAPPWTKQYVISRHHCPMASQSALTPSQTIVGEMPRSSDSFTRCSMRRPADSWRRVSGETP